MKWYEGGIPTAIQAARQNKAVFIVFISGEDDASTTMESELHQQNVTKLCEENKCVAVKLIAESNDSKFFSQIYPVVVIPSTFFIGDTGVPLEVIGEVKSREDFFAKVKAALEMQKNKSQQPSQGEESLSRTVQAQTATTSTSAEQRESCSDGSGDDVASAAPTENLPDKVERAKQLVEEKRLEKTRKEQEDQRRKELERRDEGQGVQRLRQTQKEREILDAKREYKKEKEEDKLARQRVKEEIARDRAEKAARFQKEKDERTIAADESKRQKLAEQQAALSAEQSRRSEFSRIQFRLPDGSSVTHQFPATDRFETVHNFITARVGSAVSLSTTFPRRTFTPSDQNLTLRELDLAPSAAILVIPGGTSTSGVRSSSGGLSLTNVLFAPFIFVWNIIASLFGLGGSSTSSSSTSASQQQQSATASAARGGDRKPDGAYQRGSSSSRQEGSVRRFHNAQDDEDDDDRNTWNGNSTQQM